MVRGRTGSCVSLLLTQFVVDRGCLAPQSQSALHFFFFFFYKFGSRCFILHAIITLSPSHSPLSRAEMANFFYFLIFPPHLHWPSAHTSRGAINPFQLWPLDMLTVDDLCWCRCYVKSAPLRPHSAGAHLDCTQAGKMHPEALLSSVKILCWAAFGCFNF